MAALLRVKVTPRAARNQVIDFKDGLLRLRIILAGLA